MGLTNTRETMTAQQQKKTSSGSGLMTATVLAAAGAGAYYYHKDMTQEELKEAGQNYAAKTKELACQAYDVSKQYVQAAAYKAAELAKEGCAKLQNYLYPEEAQEIDAQTFAEEADTVDYVEDEQSEL